MIRLFVGLEIPDDASEALVTLQNGIPGARWIAPDNMHITLRFMGEVDEATAGDIHENLETLRAPAFDLEISGTGSFGKGHRARTLWAGLTPTEPLSHLQSKIESACVRAGCEAEGRKFNPHVTLARLKDSPPAKVAAFEEANNLLHLGPLPLTHFTLFSSHLSQKGASYTVEAQYPLTFLASGGFEG